MESNGPGPKEPLSDVNFEPSAPNGGIITDIPTFIYQNSNYAIILLTLILASTGVFIFGTSYKVKTRMSGQIASSISLNQSDLPTFCGWFSYTIRLIASQSTKKVNPIRLYSSNSTFIDTAALFPSGTELSSPIVAASSYRLSSHSVDYEISTEVDFSGYVIDISYSPSVFNCSFCILSIFHAVIISIMLYFVRESLPPASYEFVLLSSSILYQMPGIFFAFVFGSGFIFRVTLLLSSAFPGCSMFYLLEAAESGKRIKHIANSAVASLVWFYSLSTSYKSPDSFSPYVLSLNYILVSLYFLYSSLTSLFAKGKSVSSLHSVCCIAISASTSLALFSHATSSAGRWLLLIQEVDKWVSSAFCVVILLSKLTKIGISKDERKEFLEEKKKDDEFIILEEKKDEKKVEFQASPPMTEEDVNFPSFS